MYRTHIKQEYQSYEYEQSEYNAQPEKNHLAPPVIQPKRDKGHDGVGHQEPKYEPEHVGVVVDPRQQPKQEEDRHHADQL